MSGTIKTFPDDEITMVNSRSQVKAKPGPLNSAGTAFGVTFSEAANRATVLLQGLTSLGWRRQRCLAAAVGSILSTPAADAEPTSLPAGWLQNA